MKNLSPSSRLILAAIFALQAGSLAQSPTGLTNQNGSTDTKALEEQVRARRQSMAVAWRTFQESLIRSRASAEERIAAVEEWQASRQADLAAIAALEKDLAAKRSVSAAPALPVPTQPVESDPVLRAINEIDRHVVTAMADLDSQRPTAEQRIQWIDDFLALNEATLEERDRLRSSWMKQKRAAAPVQTPAPAPASRSPRQARIEQLTSEIREILNEANALPAEERIAFIDARQAVLREREDERQRLQQQEKLSTRHP